MSTAIAKNLQVGADPTATNNFTIYQPATPDGTLRIGNGNTGITSSLLTLTSAGNLGIGTSSPGAKLHAYGGASQLLLENPANTAVYARWKRPNREYYLALDINNNGGTEFSLYDATAAATRWTVDSSGNLGLGVTPSAWSGSLLNSGAFQLGAGYGSLYAYSNAITLGSNVYYNSNGNKYFASGAGASAYQQIGGVHYWLTAPSGTAGNAISFTQAMTLDASGNLLVGTTSNTASSKIMVSAVAQRTIGSQRDGTDVQTHFGFYNPNGQVGSITTSGTSTAFNTSSDYRLKNITGSITTSGAYIDSLNPVEGTWKADGSIFVGLLAHEAQEASRTIVATGTKDGEEMQGMDYSSAEIIANLIAEVKSLRQRLAAAGI